MQMQKVLYVGLDVHKVSISATVAEGGRDGDINYVGAIPNTPLAVSKLAKGLAKRGRLEFCYEAGAFGYGLYRQLTSLGHGCAVVATSMIPRRPGDRIKTDRRDSQRLAVLHRSGDLTRVWVPDEQHEAMRDLTRSRIDAVMHLMRARQQLFAFLLRHGRSYAAGKHWTQRHRSWLAGQTFDQPTHQIVFQDYLEAVWSAQDRRDQLAGRITAEIPQWSMGPLVEALRALRGLDYSSASTFVAAIGDLGRFENPRQLMAYVGLVPSEQSSGDRIRRGGITKTGNGEARRMLIEAAWSYRYPPRVAKEKAEIIVRLPKPVRDIAWKAQLRLCKRYRALSAAGKRPTVVVAAIARELAGFIWAIGQEVMPAAP
ncbi:IS110 family transposase [Bradyrhizobium elkanii]|uniref:IS110 family transposase n=1 Tax=Bradyrhizobium elkanii TaxID=29448 RepID=UPI00216844C8|nr:IS110 family transposase [Bradyrhizobium elkanii]